jgi:hypothetical protein
MSRTQRDMTTSGMTATEVESEEVLESPEELQRQIQELQKKFLQSMEKEEQDSVEAIDMPLANIMLTVGHGNRIPKKGVTPAEVAILAAMHHKNAGGNPIANIVPTGTVKIDPLDLKRVLIGKYSLEKVTSLFPGPSPVFPMKFIRAIKMGISVNLNPERLMDFHVVSSTSGAGD